MFEDAQDLMAAIEGEYGEELQEQALAFAQEIGLVDQWIADEEAEEAGGYDEALEQEFQRVESQIGRKLTQGEEQAMLDSISPTEQQEGVIPNLVQEYGPQLASARDHEAGREHLAAEAAQEVFDQQAAEKAQPSFGVPEPAGGGGRFADDGEDH
jgi:hypothetical protein